MMPVLGFPKGPKQVKDNIWHRECYRCDAFQCCSRSSKYIYCRISAPFIAAQQNWALKKKKKTTFHLSSPPHAKWTRHKSAAEHDFFPGSTAAVTRARHLVTLVHWSPCPFSSSAASLFVSQQSGSRFSLWLLQSLPHQQFLSLSLPTGTQQLPLALVSKCLCGFCTSPWTYPIPLISQPQYEHGALVLCLCNSIIFQMHLQMIIPSNPQILLCLPSSP